MTRKRIEARAYEIWETEGRPDGHAERHWREAEAEIVGKPAEIASGGATPATKAKRTPSPRTAKPKAPRGP